MAVLIVGGCRIYWLPPSEFLEQGHDVVAADNLSATAAQNLCAAWRTDGEEKSPSMWVNVCDRAAVRPF